MALLALLVALFTLVALVAVYARLRQLEAGRVQLSGYAALVGRAAPAAVSPRDGELVAVVAVLDADCALCRGVWSALCGAADELRDEPARFVAVVDRLEHGFDQHPRCELRADVGARADLFEGYSPTLLAVDATGTVTHRSFVYPDTDVRALLLDLTKAAGPQERTA